MAPTAIQGLVWDWKVGITSENGREWGCLYPVAYLLTVYRPGIYTTRFNTSTGRHAFLRPSSAKK